jgi:hypothetical protein
VSDSENVQDPLQIDVQQSLGVEEAAKRAFGVENRRLLLGEYFSAGHEVDAQNAWLHVYRLLLWVDRSISLAHCYESDKCQPGRPWYLRSLRFHDWVATKFEIGPDAVQREIDWLFTRAIRTLAEVSGRARVSMLTKAAEQRRPYAGRSFPEPGEDAELLDIIIQTLGETLREPPAALVRRELSDRITAHLASENKRKNLLGEGFEDTLASIFEQIPEIARNYRIFVRTWLHEIPGFNPPRQGTKGRQVDLALVRSDGHRTLVTAKWSVRSDREEQFRTDFADYADLESGGCDFDYVLVTNEFDAARLVRACDSRRQNGYLFSRVVHINPEGPSTAYEPEARGKVVDMRARIASGRLTSLESWLLSLFSVVPGEIP